jgi:hypothetical protein
MFCDSVSKKFDVEFESKTMAAVKLYSVNKYLLSFNIRLLSFVVDFIVDIMLFIN